MQCAYCENSAVGSCSHCGRFYCSDHGSACNRFGYAQYRWYCTDCTLRIEKMAARTLPIIIICTIIGVLMPILIFALLQR